MESLDLVKSGIEISQILITYLAKDAMGAEFLKNYLTSQSSQAEAVHGQQAALQKLIESSAVIDEETKSIATKALQNNERLSIIFSAVESLRESVDRIEKEYKEYNEQFKTLISQTNEINALVDSIKDISAQTNLLSFNASIEAARAGVAGKGFRIIANEVKKLSDDTNKTSETIKHKVTDLVKSIGNLERATKDNSAALSRLNDETGTTLENFDKVRAINSENNSNVGQVSNYVKENINDIKNMIQVVESVDKANQTMLAQFAKSASENEMLFNDLYSFAYEIKALFEDLQK
ncbi:MAG: hypothetical protein J1D88_04550 [Treponema sp.]|nr:hypothetical protein [Treponema sp.]